MEIEWIIALGMLYVLVGMFIADIIFPKEYDSDWFLVILLWLPVAILLIVLSIIFTIYFSIRDLLGLVR